MNYEKLETKKWHLPGNSVYLSPRASPPLPNATCPIRPIIATTSSNCKDHLSLSLSFCWQNENRALRLKEPASLALSAGGNSGGYVDPDGTAIVMSSELLPAPTPDPRVTWNYFDEQGWVGEASFPCDNRLWDFDLRLWPTIRDRHLARAYP